MSKVLRCACGCGRTSDDLSREYPLAVTIVSENNYGLPIGKRFPFARRKEGDGSPYPIEIIGNWPAYFHGQVYQMQDHEVVIEKKDD